MKNRRLKKIFLVICLIYIIGFIFFTKSVISLVGIETLIRYILLAFFVIFFIIYVKVSMKKLNSKKYGVFYLLSFLSVIFIITFFAGTTVIDYVYSKVSSFSEEKYLNYTSYLISLKDNEEINIIGMIADENDIEGNILAQRIIEENDLQKGGTSLKEFDDYTIMLNALYNEEIDAAFVSSNYVTLFENEDGFENIGTDTKIIYQKTDRFKNKDNEIYSSKKLSEPFSVLILGVDSKKDGLDANAAFNGDVLILATFNPKTLKMTIFSMPRDTYTPIVCKDNEYGKISASAAYGTGCVIDTVENFTGIEVDYYVKINFKGVVDLVNAVGGVEVDIEKPSSKYNGVYDCKGMFCEQDSNRDWTNPIYIKPGLQTINGEEALAYARNRHQYSDGDIARNRHQQEIIMAIAKKLIKLDSFDKFKNILDTIGNNIATNMSTNQILSSYNILKSMTEKMNSGDFIDIQKSYLETYNLNVWVVKKSRITMALGYFEDSINDITNAMKENLELSDITPIKTFNFSVNNNYEDYVAGKGFRKIYSNGVLPNYIGKTKADALEFCNEYNVSCSFVSVKKGKAHYNNSVKSGLIGDEDPHYQVLLRNAKQVTFYINE